MSYHTYTTEALVCGSSERLGAHRSLRLFTREAGMLSALARSVREERSRQRYALQEFSLLRVSLIRGRAGWRIGSVEPWGSVYQQATTRNARSSVVSLVRLTQRFVGGEEPVPVVFDELVAALQTIGAHPALASDIEQLASVRILAALGYVPSAAVPSLPESGAYAAAARTITDATRTGLRTLIETATVQSQL